MSDDPLSDLLSTRHLHNRSSRHAPRGSKHNEHSAGSTKVTQFQPRQIFGTRQLDCEPVKRIGAALTGNYPASHLWLEVYRLNEAGDVFICQLVARNDQGNWLEASALLAADRKTMQRTVAELEGQTDKDAEVDEDSDNDNDGEVDEESLRKMKQFEATTHRGKAEQTRKARRQQPRRGKRMNLSSMEPQEDQGEDESEGEDEQAEDQEEEEEEEEEEEDSDEAANRRARTFEKNSFRSPRFWLKFRGRASKDVLEDATNDKIVEGDGYLVFHGRQSRKLKGTLSCPALGWDNVPVKGLNHSSMGPRDTQVLWPKSAEVSKD